jgi:hypothetical protein
MLWIPIALSGLPFTFNPGSGDAVLDGSTVTCPVATGADAEWSIEFTDGLAHKLRITANSFSGAAASSFDWEFGGSPVGTQANTTTPPPAAAWTPTPFEADGLDIIQFQAASAVVNYSFSFTIEVAVESNYNCECDDTWPRETLAQLRRHVFVKLGYAANASYPPGMAETLDEFIREAQTLSYYEYPGYRTSRFYTWALAPGVRFYGLTENADACTLRMNPDKIEWVGISQSDNFWRPLVNGIKPTYYYGDIQSWPQYYEVRQCIELWPAPSDATWLLRIKGNFGLRPLVADGDYSTIDPTAIKLLAVANAKAWRGQRDADNYLTWWQNHIGNLRSGSHMTRRYVPSEYEFAPPPLPILTGFPGGLP